MQENRCQIVEVFTDLFMCRERLQVFLYRLSSVKRQNNRQVGKEVLWIEKQQLFVGNVLEFPYLDGWSHTRSSEVVLRLCRLQICCVRKVSDFGHL